MASFADSMFGRLSGGRQVAIIAVGVVVTAAVFGVSRWATAPTMVPLYADVPVENVRKITDKLTESGVEYKLDNTGTTIMVASADLAKARVDLASADMPSAGPLGWALFDKPQWGSTDFTQKINFRRALEGELERTIGKMKDVEAVQVHVALEEDALFQKNERQTKASVMLTMAGGGTAKPETVRSIAMMVASSIGGLDPERVTIVDARGQALTMQDDGSLAGLSSRQLAVQQEVEGYLEHKADRLLSSLVGNGNARVQVSASINFDKIERTTQAVDPDKQSMATEQKSEVTPSSPQQGAGYTQTAVSYENSRSTETFSGAIGNIKKVTVAVLVADKSVPAPITDTSANAVPAPPIITQRTPEELQRIETLVRNALGVDSLRGDMISVVSAPFDIPAVPAVKHDTLPTPDMIARIQTNPKPLVAIAALVVLLIVALVALSALKPKKQPQIAGNERQALAPTQGFPELPASAAMQAAMQEAADVEQQQLAERKRPVILPPPATTPEREQAMATVDQRLDAATRVTRGWLQS